MKALLLAALLGLPTLSIAQSWSTGLRTGVGCYNGKSFSTETYGYEKAHKYAWEKEAFIRYDAKNKLGFEAAINHISEEYVGESYGWCGVGLPATFQTGTRIKDDYYGLNLRVQYKLPGCPMMKRLSHNPGVAITPTLRTSQTRDVYYNTASDSYSTSDGYPRRYEMGVQFGVEDLIRYQLCDHMDVQTLVGYRFNPGGMVLRHGFTTQIGVSYRF